MVQPNFPLGISAILIDLDGTLLHTAPELAEAANRMLRDMGRPAASQDLLMGYIGNGISWLVKRALTGDMRFWCIVGISVVRVVPFVLRVPLLCECHHPFGLPRPTTATTAAAKRELSLANAMGQLDRSEEHTS